MQKDKETEYVLLGIESFTQSLPAPESLEKHVVVVVAQPVMEKRELEAGACILRFMKHVVKTIGFKQTAMRFVDILRKSNIKDTSTP